MKVYHGSDTFAKETHQICFCTGRSLWMIDRTDKEYDFEYQIIKTGESVIEQLMLHFGFDEEKVANALYVSATFACLSDETTVPYLKPWQEIYEMLKSELKM